MAEFLLHRTEDNRPTIWIVVAKQSSPRPDTQPNFAEFIGEIREKLANALALGAASILQRHPLALDELPEQFKTLNLHTARIRLLLIMNGHQRSWLPPLQDALRKALHATAKTWALGPNAVVVINHVDAKRFNLISAP